MVRFGSLEVQCHGTGRSSIFNHHGKKYQLCVTRLDVCITHTKCPRGVACVPTDATGCVFGATQHRTAHFAGIGLGSTPRHVKERIRGTRNRHVSAYLECCDAASAGLLRLFFSGAVPQPQFLAKAASEGQHGTLEVGVSLPKYRVLYPGNTNTRKLMSKPRNSLSQQSWLANRWTLARSTFDAGREVTSRCFTQRHSWLSLWIARKTTWCTSRDIKGDDGLC